MSEAPLLNRRVLVAEDEYLLAEEMREELEEGGAVVVGPAATVDQALALIAADPAIDAAVMDINLRGEKIFPAADALTLRGVPLVLTTGYDAAELPERFRQVPRCEKPVSTRQVVRAVERALAG